MQKEGGGTKKSKQPSPEPAPPCRRCALLPGGPASSLLRACGRCPASAPSSRPAARRCRGRGRPWRVGLRSTSLGRRHRVAWPLVLVQGRQFGAGKKGVILSSGAAPCQQPCFPLCLVPLYTTQPSRWGCVPGGCQAPQVMGSMQQPARGAAPVVYSTDPSHPIAKQVWGFVQVMQQPRMKCPSGAGIQASFGMIRNWPSWASLPNLIAATSESAFSALTEDPEDTAPRDQVCSWQHIRLDWRLPGAGWS